MSLAIQQKPNKKPNAIKRAWWIATATQTTTIDIEALQALNPSTLSASQQQSAIKALYGLSNSRHFKKVAPLAMQIAPYLITEMANSKNIDARKALAQAITPALMKAHPSECTKLLQDKDSDVWLAAVKNIDSPLIEATPDATIKSLLEADNSPIIHAICSHMPASYFASKTDIITLAMSRDEHHLISHMTAEKLAANRAFTNALLASPPAELVYVIEKNPTIALKYPSIIPGLLKDSEAHSTLLTSVPLSPTLVQMFEGEFIEMVEQQVNTCLTVRLAERLNSALINAAPTLAHTLIDKQKNEILKAIAINVDGDVATQNPDIIARLMRKKASRHILQTRLDTIKRDTALLTLLRPTAKISLVPKI